MKENWISRNKFLCLPFQQTFEDNLMQNVIIFSTADPETIIYSNTNKTETKGKQKMCSPQIIHEN